ncbi:hypothetical protein MHAE_14180 [Mycobacterium haemophilum DSM 44634]
MTSIDTQEYVALLPAGYAGGQLTNRRTVGSSLIRDLTAPQLCTRACYTATSGRWNMRFQALGGNTGTEEGL